MRSRRALLYMPGDDMRKIRKAVTLGVDSICMDLEDAVAINRKTEARQSVVAALTEMDFGASERLVRINAPDTGLAEMDLHAILAARPDGILLPKVESPSVITWASQLIGAAEQRNGWQANSIALLAMIETARGVLRLESILESVMPHAIRLQALLFGAEDYASEIGAQRTPQRQEVLYARSKLVTAAAAYDMQAIDMVYIHLQDSAGLLGECRQAVQMGYSGKQVIHPNQVAPVQTAFTPDEDAIARAVLLQQAYDEHQDSGKGVFALEGKLVEAPHIKSAQRVLSQARAAGKI